MNIFAAGNDKWATSILSDGIHRLPLYVGSMYCHDGDYTHHFDCPDTLLYNEWEKHNWANQDLLEKHAIFYYNNEFGAYERRDCDEWCIIWGNALASK